MSRKKITFAPDFIKLLNKNFEKHTNETNKNISLSPPPDLFYQAPSNIPNPFSQSLNSPFNKIIDKHTNETFTSPFESPFKSPISSQHHFIEISSDINIKIDFSKSPLYIDLIEKFPIIENILIFLFHDNENYCFEDKTTEELLNYSNKHGTTLLHEICLHNLYDCAKYLFSKYKEFLQINVYDDFNYLPISYTTDINIIKLLIDNGSHPPNQEYTLTEMFLTECKSDHLSNVEYIMEHLNQNQLIRLEYCHWLLYVESVEMIKLIESYGGDIESINMNQQLWDHLYNFSSNKSLVEYLIDEYSEKTHDKPPYLNNLLLLSKNIEVTKTLLHHGADIHSTNIQGQNLIHLFSKYNNYASLEYILTNYQEQMHDNINQKDSEGFTPLQYSTNIETFHLLVSHGANPNYVGVYRFYSTDKKDLKLLESLFEIFPEKMKSIIDNPENIFQTNQIEIINFLLSEGVQINQLDKFCLIDHLLNENNETIIQFIEEKEIFNSQNKNGDNKQHFNQSTKTKTHFQSISKFMLDSLFEFNRDDFYSILIPKLLIFKKYDLFEFYIHKYSDSIDFSKLINLIENSTRYDIIQLLLQNNCNYEECSNC